METGEELKLNPLDVRKAYQKSMKEFEHNLKLKCGQYSIDLVQADISKGFDQMLLPYLLKRKNSINAATFYCISFGVDIRCLWRRPSTSFL